MSGSLSWYFNRLSRMQPAEIVHRVGEAVKRAADRYGRFDFETFESNHDGPLVRLPLVSESASDELLAKASETRRRIEAGRFGWLGQEWPAMDANWVASLWHVDPVSGGRWPGAEARGAEFRKAGGRGDVKFVWEPNRLQMLQPLALLSARGDHGAADLAFAIVEGWMRANPPYSGVNWSSGIEVASRVVSALALISAIGWPTDYQRATLLNRFFLAHARRLARYPSLYSSANNHRISELGALLLLRISLPQLRFDGPDRSQLLSELESEVFKQFHADGVGAEQSPTYTAYSLEWFLLSAIAAEDSGLTVSRNYRHRIAAVAAYLQWLLDDAGKPPRIGDDDEGRVLAIGFDPEPRYVASVLNLALRWLGEAPLDDTMRDADLRDVLLPIRSVNAKPGLVGDRHFPEGGASVVRRATERGTAVLTVDHAPLGFLSIAAHGHADALALTLSVGGDPVLVDAGTYLYHAGGPVRDIFKGTGAHNTLQIEDGDQSTIVGPFAWSNHARTHVEHYSPGHLSAVCDGWKSRFGVLHRRSVDWSAWPIIRVEDHLAGTPSKALDWRSGLSIGPGCTVSISGDLAEIQSPAGGRIRLRAEGMQWSRALAPYSPAFNHKMEIERVELAGVFNGEGGSRVAAFTIELVS